MLGVLGVLQAMTRHMKIRVQADSGMDELQYTVYSSNSTDRHILVPLYFRLLYVQVDSGTVKSLYRLTLYWQTMTGRL